MNRFEVESHPAVGQAFNRIAWPQPLKPGVGLFPHGIDDPRMDDGQICVAVLQQGSVKRHP